MKKILFLLVISVFLANIGNAQDLANAKKYYKQGVQSFINKDYKAAESFFSMSLVAQQHPSTYYNLAVTKKMLGDHCSSCLNLKKAGELSNEKAKNLYNKRCCNNIKIDFKKNSPTDKNSSYTLIRKGICDDYNVQVINYVYEDGKTFSYVVENLEKGVVVGLNLKKKENGDEFFEVLVNEKASINDKEVDASIVTKSFIERKATYPGGNTALTAFLSSNVSHVQNLQDRDVFGKVVVAFDIDESGEIINVNIVKHGNADVDNEALNIIKKMPKWLPAERDGKKYKSHYLLPINFNIVDFGEDYEIEDDNQSNMDFY